jgi:hypothetical protein
MAKRRKKGSQAHLNQNQDPNSPRPMQQQSLGLKSQLNY